jgi:hypothetical protein
MTDEERDADLAAAIDERMRVRREAARRKRANTNRFLAEKKTRRAAGLEARHRIKLTRQNGEPT